MTKEECQKLSIVELKAQITQLEKVLAEKLEVAADKHFYEDLPLLLVGEATQATGCVYSLENLDRVIAELNSRQVIVTYETPQQLQDVMNTTDPELLRRQFEEVNIDRMCGKLFDIRLTETVVGPVITGTLTINGPEYERAQALIDKGLPSLAMRAFTRTNSDGEHVIEQVVTWDLVDYQGDV